MADLDPDLARAQVDELVDASVLIERAGNRLGRHDLLRHFATELLDRLDRLDAADQTSTGHRPPGHSSIRDVAEDGLYAHMTALALAATAVVEPARVPLADGITSLSSPVETAPAFLLAAEALAWFAAEYDTVVALVARAHSARPADPRTWQLAWAFELYLEGRGLSVEWLAISEAGLDAAAQAGSLPAQVEMLRGMARVKAGLGRFDDAVADMRAAIEALNAQPDPDPIQHTKTYRSRSESDQRPIRSAARSAIISVGA